MVGSFRRLRNSARSVVLRPKWCYGNECDANTSMITAVYEHIASNCPNRRGSELSQIGNYSAGQRHAGTRFPTAGGARKFVVTVVGVGVGASLRFATSGRARVLRGAWRRGSKSRAADRSDRSTRGRVERLDVHWNYRNCRGPSTAQLLRFGSGYPLRMTSCLRRGSVTAKTNARCTSPLRWSARPEKIPRDERRWNPTLAHRTRKDGAPPVVELAGPRPASAGKRFFQQPVRQRDRGRPLCGVRCAQRRRGFLKRMLISRPKISIEQAAGREKTHDGQRDGGAARVLDFFAV